MRGKVASHRIAVLIKHDIHYNILGTWSNIECWTKFGYHTSMMGVYPVSQDLHVQKNVTALLTAELLTSMGGHF